MSMTESESIHATFEDAIYCAKSWCGEVACEECRLYLLGDIFCQDTSRIMAQAMEELVKYRAIGTVEELQKSVKEEDVLKFYYIESEDKYVIGQRVDNFYYGEVEKTGLAFYMSRYLPWGEHIVAPETAWKEYTYPSEPKEIPFFDWLQGFMKKEYGGTVEEFRELKEKATPKKPILNPICKCPICDHVLPYALVKYCSNCGTALDCSEGKEHTENSKWKESMMRTFLGSRK